MNCKWVMSLVVTALFGASALAADAPKAAPVTKGISMDAVAKIKVGSSTRAEVTKLLGNPLRINADTCEPGEYEETWEYIGQDVDGGFKINVEFDETGVARVVSKGAARGPVIVLAADLSAEHSH